MKISAHEWEATDLNSSPRSFHALSRILSSERSVDLSRYKQDWVVRRISTRARLTRCRNLDEYTEFVRRMPEEIDRLVDALVVKTSGFFRDSAVYESIACIVFGHWREKTLETRGRVFYAWSCACAGGEEPYSLSLLWRYWKKQLGDAELRIVASDMNETAIRKARLGSYGSKAWNQIPEKYRTGMIGPSTDGLLIPPDVRRSIRFVREDALTADVKRKFDLILCRNLLIFLNGSQQDRLFTKFHDALASGGFLVLGLVETLTGPQKIGFRNVHREHRVYQKT